MRHTTATITTALMLAATAACHRPQVPQQYTTADGHPSIYPDYVDVTVPQNMAPLTFAIEERADQAMTRFTTPDGREMVCRGTQVRPGQRQWKDMARAAAGKSIGVEVFTENDGQWTRHRPFDIHVSADSIDPYISYRLISPSYVTYEELTINQRCLENYDESVIYDNMLCSDEKNGQCINCHNYQQYDPRRMQFHARQKHGGTLIAYDGELRKVNMKNDSVISAGVYPAWHPYMKLIVYSTDKTSQSFHTRNLNKIEVFDSESDLVIYDIDRNEVANVENRKDELEVFPCWAPDGRTLYYCSAHFEYADTVSHEVEIIRRAKELKYNIYSKSFDPDTRSFGPRRLVFAADSLDMSATLPRVSPDGRYLMFTLGHYGCFHIWHHEADLWLIDLATGNVRAIDEINSPDTESYHSWSSNGRWVVFSSRRDDGGYTRPFIAHMSRDGVFGKPFELPQADPTYHRQLLKSYNIPEFMTGRVEVSPQTFARILKTDGQPVARFVRHL